LTEETLELGDAERSDRVSESWWLTGEKSGVDLGKAKVRRLGQSTRHIAASSRSNFLDMLRAIAICFVVLGHNFHAVIPGSSIGVAVFFALSGYLITSIIIEEGKNHSIVAFYVRRFTRIWPPYVFAIAVNLLRMYLAQDPHREEFLRALPGYLTFTS
jgi:peptidoglycan/LPS O-acetylase OafA/YrhL